MKIRPRIILIFGFLFLLIMVITTYATSYFVRLNLKVHSQEEILALTINKAENVKEFIRGQENFMANLGASQVLRDYLGSPTLEEKSRAKERLTRTLGTDNNLLELLLMDKTGRVVISTGLTREGLDRSSDTFFTQAQEKVFFKDIYYSESINQVNYAVAAPLKDENGNLEGVVVGRYKPDSFYAVVLSRAGLGKTGENFVINSDYYFLTPSLFTAEDQVLKKQAVTVNTKECFDPQEVSQIKTNGYQAMGLDNVFSFTNYRGVQVVGTHAYIPETSWCLISTKDQTEIYAPARQLTYIIILISFFSLFFLIIIGYIVASRIAKPIEKLDDGTRKVAAGDLDYKVATSDQDEIGELSRSFDRMTKKIKESRQGVAREVKEQTRELREKENELEKQQSAIMNILEDVEREKDITSRERDKLNTILHSIGDGVFVIDLDQKIILVNKIALSIVGRSDEKVIGKKYSRIFKFISEKTNKRNDQFILESLRTGKMQTMPHYTNIVAKDGREIPVSDSASPLKIKGGQVIGCVVVFHDMTEERRIDRAKTEFVSLASHQLRTPLSAINWFSEMLLNGDAGKLNKEQKRYLAEVYRGNKRMVSLVNALLNVSRIEMGTLAVEPEPTSLTELSDSVLRELEQQILKKKLEVTKNYQKGLPLIKLNPKLIRIVFQNLLSNAVKYTPRQGKIKVVLKKVKDKIKIIIRDTGWGIPKREQNKIFTKLFRADNVKEKISDGTGLGLYIVKAIVKESKGKVWFKSAKNKGTTFFVELPLAGMKKKEGAKGLIGSIE